MRPIPEFQLLSVLFCCSEPWRVSNISSIANWRAISVSSSSSSIVDTSLSGRATCGSLSAFFVSLILFEEEELIAVDNSVLSLFGSFESRSPSCSMVTVPSFRFSCSFLRHVQCLPPDHQPIYELSQKHF